MWICPFCSGSIPEKAVLCKHCGKSVEVEKPVFKEDDKSRYRKCPYCAEEIKQEANICRFCGKQLITAKKIDEIKTRKIGIAGIIALSTAGIAFFMPVILMMLLAPIAFISACIELNKGKKLAGIIAIVLSIIELIIVLSTIQSCARTLSKIGANSRYSDKAILNWKEHLKLAYHSVDSSVYSDYQTWSIEVENIGDKNLKEAQFNLTLKDAEGNIVSTKSDRFLHRWDNPMRQGEVKKFTMLINKIKSKKISDTFSYSFDIFDYEE